MKKLTKVGGRSFLLYNHEKDKSTFEHNKDHGKFNRKNE